MRVFEIVNAMMNAIVYFIAFIILILWIAYEVSPKRTQRKMFLLLEDFYDLLHLLFVRFYKKTVNKWQEDYKLKEQEAKTLSLDEIKELEKNEFDNRLRIALKNKNIIDDEFEDVEEQHYFKSNSRRK